jgi:DNA-binding transcriptional LysR family regulator
MISQHDHSARAATILPDALADLSLRQLQSFRAVADEGSFHAAAGARLHQSAVSQHVMGLEGALGVRLFDRSRGRRTVELTEAGRLLLGHVETIADRLQAARADLVAYAAGETGTLRVGVYQSVGTRILPAIIGRFSQAWPAVEVQLSEAASDEGLMDMVEPGRLDLLRRAPDARRAVRRRRAPPGSVRARRPGVVAAGRPGGGPLAAADRRAAPHRLPVLSQHEVGGAPAAVAGRSRTVFRSEDNGTVRLRRRRLGSALVPLLAVDTADPLVSIIPTDSNRAASP